MISTLRRKRKTLLILTAYASGAKEKQISTICYASNAKTSRRKRCGRYDTSEKLQACARFAERLKRTEERCVNSAEEREERSEMMEESTANEDEKKRKERRMKHNAYMRSYAKKYREENPDRMALFKLQTALNACLKRPGTRKESAKKIKEYLIKANLVKKKGDYQE